MRHVALLVMGSLLLAGCAATVEPVPDQPTMYLSMANGGAKLDPAAAASMISLYRQNNGLGAVEVDPALMALAEEQSTAMAKRNKLDHDVKAPLAFANQFHSKVDWDYWTEPEPHLLGRRLYSPRGKMLGGCRRQRCNPVEGGETAGTAIRRFDTPGV